MLTRKQIENQNEVELSYGMSCIYRYASETIEELSPLEWEMAWEYYGAKDSIYKMLAKAGASSFISWSRKDMAPDLDYFDHVA